MNQTIASNQAQTRSGKISFWSVLWSILWILLGILLVLRIFVYQQVNVVGASMEPNYFTDEMLVVDQRQQTLQRGQVVAVYEDKEIARKANYFTRFDPKTRFFLKRVIGLPGEQVEMVGGKVIIYNSTYPNGVVLSEDYIASEVKRQEELLDYYYPKTKIEQGTYFLLGDNRTNSTDSRVRGAFPTYSIFGQEVFRYWPVARASWFDLPPYTFTDLSSEMKQKINQAKSKQTQVKVIQ
jgi:signal peptidase I